MAALFAFLAASSKAEPAPPPRPKPAVLKVSGYGVLGNRELKRMLQNVELADKKVEYFDSDMIEDAALILAARVKRDGYLRPSIRIRLRTADNRRLEVNADQLLDNPLPRGLRVVRAQFSIRKGRLYYFSDIEFRGLTSIPGKQAKALFVETATLLHTRRGRVYTPERLRRGLFGLSDLLNQQGYRNATVEATELHKDDATGAVRVEIDVDQGRQFIVRSVREEFYGVGSTKPEQTRTEYPGKPFSRLWAQDFSLGLRTNEFHKGFPDTAVELTTLHSVPEHDRENVDLLATVKTGPQIRVGAVKFEGQKKTRLSLLKRRVRIQRGELLDPVQVETGRYRLSRLGIFDTVDLDYQPVDEATRDVIYRVKEGKTLNISLLFGWGSYEELRGGMEADVNNLWGEGHQIRLTAIQSLKSSSGNFTYTIPELVGKDIDLFFDGSALRREEISFTRKEYGGGLGLHKYFQAAATDLSARYNYQILNAEDFNTVQEVASEGLTNPAVGSVIFEMKHDKRDNPLYPHEGYKVFASVETATEYLGGDASYERFEVAPSWHQPLGGGRYFSLGVSQGVDISFGSPAYNLPFNKRFFPGGGNSIRGYREGEASPRNQSGQLVGAETYTLGTVEFEQALTPRWSVVLFSDSLGFAQRIQHYPFDTGLFSMGGGLRWRTLIGPIRLEYGKNINPRPGDPQGTLQFSLGYPF
jgi:outer membrane protein insertion porin family